MLSFTERRQHVPELVIADPAVQRDEAADEVEGLERHVVAEVLGGHTGHPTAHGLECAAHVLDEPPAGLDQRLGHRGSRHMGQMVGPEGSVTGIDMTPEMLAKARIAAAASGVGNVEFVEGEAEHLPFPNASFDVVASNGVIDLVPDKDAVFAELYRVLAPGGRMQIADVTIQNPVSAEGRRNIDLWTG